MTRSIPPRPVLSALVAAVVLSSAFSAPADPPVIAPGECLYLVGAPPGAPAAETEETFSGSLIRPDCPLDAHVDLNRDGENMVQAWMIAPPPPSPLLVDELACSLRGWVGTAFRVESDEPTVVNGWVTVRGRAVGLFRNISAREVAGQGDRVWVRVRLVELGPDGAASTVARDTPLTHQFGYRGTREIDEAISTRLSARLRSGRDYRVEVELELQSESILERIDFGSLGSMRFVRYDAIEVCLDEGRGAAGNAAELDLERDLFERRCLPGLWLPEAEGGHLEAARNLVALRLAQAEASGARGVNLPVAMRRLEEADRAVADVDYQRACRSLVEGLHALTTP